MLDDLEGVRREVDPLADDAATMDDEEWFRAAQARQARERRQRASAGSRRATPGEAARTEIERAYANLDCKPGMDLKAVRAAWKAKMKKYHPDNFHGEPKKREAATRLTALLNESYQKLETHLKAKGDKE